MKLNIINNIKQYFFTLKEKKSTIVKKIVGYRYSGEIESLRGSIKLQRSLSNASDAWAMYFINKDGSGRKITAWGEENYPKGTFCSVINSAVEMRNSNNKMLLNDKNIEQLIEHFESEAVSAKDKK